MKKLYLIAQRSLVSALLCSLVGNVMAQTYTVTSLADDGSAGTLRDALFQVNSGAVNVINFDFHLLGTAPYTISLTADLPVITHPVTINGYSEPSAVAGPIGSRTISVNIDGGANATNGIATDASGLTISGLAIFNNLSSGILVVSGVDNVNIWGNFIGTQANGSVTGVGNGSNGIQIGSLSDATANNNIVVGTNGDGTNDANEGNLIVGNGSSGTLDGGIVAYNTTNSKFSGNIVGLALDGTTAGLFANSGSGIVISDRSTGDVIGTNGDGTSDALEQNIVSNNAKNGVWLVSNANGNTIAGNILGLTSGGTTAGNSLYGVAVDNSSNNIIGTNADGTADAQERNFISGNLTGGVNITSGNLGAGFNANANGNTVAGNTIGLALDNTTAAGNTGDGVFLQAQQATFQVFSNVIGSNGNGINESVKPNLIASNSFNGVNLKDATTSGLVMNNRISSNSIFNNGGLGIILTNSGSVGTTGVTPNQSNGFDASGLNPNDLLNFPLITSVTNTSTNIIFNGIARPGALLEFYLSDKQQTSPAPASGLGVNFGQGKTLLFQAIQGGTLNGITDIGDAAASYTNAQEGTTTNGASPITTDRAFTFSVPYGQLGLTNGPTYTFSAVAIDAANTTGNANNTSAFGGNSDATFTTLPVTLVNFSGHEDGSKIDLQWTTSNEVNNLRFDVQRSANGSDFKTIGSVKGNGTTDVTQTYTFTDAAPNPNLNYYRLSQVDIDGKSTFSKVLVFRNTVTNNVLIYPTIFTDNLNVSVNTPNADQLLIRVIDQTGHLVQSYQQPTGAGLNSFYLSTGLDRLAPGAYFLTVTGRSLSYTQQIIKN